MSIYRAAIGTVRPGSLVVLVESRKHTYHASRSAAFRAVERVARRGLGREGGIDWRGYVWPVSAYPNLTTAELQAGRIPAGVETIAL